MSRQPDAPWYEQAACRPEASPPDLDFYAPDVHEQRRAVALCRTSCPVQSECLQVALKHEDPFGVWGGTTPTQRYRALHVSDDTKRSACPRCGSRKVVTSRERRVRVQAICGTCGLTWMRRRPPVKKRGTAPPTTKVGGAAASSG